MSNQKRDICVCACMSMRESARVRNCCVVVQHTPLLASSFHKAQQKLSKQNKNKTTVTTARALSQPRFRVHQIPRPSRSSGLRGNMISRFLSFLFKRRPYRHDIPLSNESIGSHHATRDYLNFRWLPLFGKWILQYVTPSS